MRNGKPKAVVRGKRAGSTPNTTKQRRTRASRHFWEQDGTLSAVLRLGANLLFLLHSASKLVDWVIKLINSTKPSIARKLPHSRRIPYSTTGRDLPERMVSTSGFVFPGDSR